MSDTEIRLLTVILNYRTPEMTEQAAEAALREMEGIAGEILIVDNDSGDGSFETLSAAIRRRGWNADNRVRVLQSGHNGGYGYGNNVGIRAGLSDGRRPDFIYVQNSDAFPDPGAIHRLLEALLADPKVGFAGSYIHGEDNTPHETAFRFPSVLGELEGAAHTGPVSRLLDRWRVSLPLPDETVEMDWICGASVLMRMDTLDAIGLYDETYFLYYDETDLCRRVWAGGWKILYVRESAVTHIGSVSTGMKTWTRIPGFWLDSRLHYLTKHHGVLYAMGADCALVIGSAIYGLRRLTGKPRRAPKGFLRDLLLHDLAALGRGLVGGVRRKRSAQYV
ncbi:MAG: glycosyltransferase [Qingshengfaniella sp.]